MQARGQRLSALAAVLLAALAGCGAEEASLPAEPVSAAVSPPEPLLEPVQEAPPLRRGMWVLCEGSQRVLDDPARIPRMIQTARELGVSDLFVQVYRRGLAWYDAEAVDSTPFDRIHAATGGDSFAALIEAAHGADMRVHAWVNVLSLAGNRDAALLDQLGDAALMVDQQGRSVLDYPDLDLPQPDRRFLRMGTPAVWLDPAAPGVAETHARIFAELALRYPDLDGLHLDYFRHPDVLPFVPGSRFGVGLGFGYGQASRARFQSETGVTAPFGAGLGNANRWDDWRREQLTRMLVMLRSAVLQVRPDIEISAAVWAYADRAYLALFQDWRGWLADDLLEFAVPMMYSRDQRLFAHKVREFAGSEDRRGHDPAGDEVAQRRIWVGLGAWLFAKTPQLAAEQLAEVEAANLPATLFSYDAIEDSPALRAALAGGDAGG